MFRTTTDDTEIAGVRIPADAKIRLCYGAANRDPRLFEDPDRFDVTRSRETLRRHIGFGFGIHACLGAALARLEMTIALETVLDRLPGLRTDPDRWEADDAHIHGERFRSPTSLPVIWDG